MVGLCEDEYAPAPLRNTALSVARETLLFGCLSVKFFSFLFESVSETCSDTIIFYLLTVLLAALPFGFAFEPRILSLGGAGVCAADFLPLLFTYNNLYYKNKIYL